MGYNMNHLAPEVKRARLEDAAEGAAPGAARTDAQPAFRVGAGVDDVADGERGPGTKYLVEELLWGLRSDAFERSALAGRKEACRSCGRRKKYFCETCTEIVGDASLVPSVRLPIDIAVIRDERENKAKSTATHAALVSPEVNIFTYPDLPAGVSDDAARAEESVLLFPSDSSVEVQAMDWSKVKRVLLIDSTWITCNQMLRDTRLKRLRHIRIQDEQTTFWRYHHHGETCLSTIECIYHTLRQHKLATDGSYAGEYDGILFYYAHFYRQIQLHYLRRPDRSFMHKSSYIHYDKAAREAAMLDALKEGGSEIGTHTQARSSLKAGKDWNGGESSSAEHGTKQLQASGDGVGNGAGEVGVTASVAEAKAEELRRRALQVLVPSPSPAIVGITGLGARRATALVSLHVRAPETLCGHSSKPTLGVQLRYRADAQRSHKPLVRLPVDCADSDPHACANVHRASDGSLWVDYDAPAAAARDQGACREETRAKAGLGCGDAGSGPVGLVWGAVMHKADEVLGVVEGQANKGPVQVQARVRFAPLGWSKWSAPFVCASSPGAARTV